MKRTFCAMLAAGLAFVLGTAMVDAQQKVLLGTSHPGGATFEIGTAIGKVISDNSGGKFDVSASITGGSSANVRVLQKKDAMGPFRLAMATTPAVYWGQNGITPFRKKQDVLALCALYPLTTVYASPKSTNITKWGDLGGKRFVVGAKGGSIYIVTQNALRHSGLFNKARKEFFSNPQNAAALKDKRVDAGFFMLNANVPAPVYMDLARTQEGQLNFFGPDEKTIKKLEESDPGVVRDVVPAGSIPGWDKDVVSWGQMWTLMASSQMSNDVAYNMVKLLMENYQQIQKYHPIGKVIKPENAMKGLSKIKLHPGAARYWKEKGKM